MYLTRTFFVGYAVSIELPLSIHQYLLKGIYRYNSDYAVYTLYQCSFSFFWSVTMPLFKTQKLWHVQEQKKQTGCCLEVHSFICNSYSTKLENSVWKKKKHYARSDLKSTKNKDNITDLKYWQATWWAYLCPPRENGAYTVIWDLNVFANRRDQK